MDQRLFEAAIMGDVLALDALLKEDPLVLWRVSLSSRTETPLHVASLAGHVDFVRKIMELVPSFAQELNKDGFAPIHLATAAGHLEVAKELLNKANSALYLLNSDLCLLKDKAGRTALHLAAIIGRVHIIGELLSNCSHQKAMDQVTPLGETVLHLAVKNSQFEAFKVLFEASEKLWGHEERVCAKDNEGKTVLEIAKATNQLQLLAFLKRQSGCHDQLDQEEKGNTLSDLFEKSWSMYLQDKDLLPIMATMIAAATFQAGLNPPSTIWENGVHLDHKCIKSAILSTSINDFFGFKSCPAFRFYTFMISNSFALSSSLVLIPFRKHVAIAPALTMISVVSLLLTYLAFLSSIAPHPAFFIFMYILTVLSCFLLFYKQFSAIGRYGWKKVQDCF